MMNRRTFLGTLAAVTAAGGLGLGGEFLRRRRLAPKDMGPVTLQPLLGRQVTMCSVESGRTLHAVVHDVSCASHRRQPGAPGTEQVSLLLAAEVSEAEAGIYRIDSPDVSLGRLFVSPVGGKSRRQMLEAVITRIV